VRRNRLGERKTLTPSEKRISYTTAPCETISQLPIRTNFIPLLPSCEKWRLEGTAKLFLLLRNTLVRPLNAGQIEELKAAFKMEF